MQGEGDSFAEPGIHRDLTDDFKAYTGDRADVHDAAREWLTDQQAATGHEHYVAIDKATGKIVGAGTSNENDRTDLSNTVTDAMADKGRNIVLHHSHPDEASFSSDDMKALAWLGTGTIGVHDIKKNSYFAALTNRVRSAIDGLPAGHAEQDIKNVFLKTIKKVTGRLQALVDNGVVKAADVDKLATDLTGRALDYAGIINYRSGRPVAEIDAGLARNIIRDGADEARRFSPSHWHGEGDPTVLGVHARAPDIGANGKMESLLGVDQRNDRTGRPISKSGLGQEDGGGRTGTTETAEKSTAPVVAGDRLQRGRPRIPSGLNQTKAEGAIAHVNEARKTFAEHLKALGNELRMWATPMALGTDRAQATAKDYANAVRKAAWQQARFMDYLGKTYDKVSRTLMWNKMDESCVAAQTAIANRAMDYVNGGMEEEDAWKQARSELPAIKAEMEQNKTGIYSLPLDQRLVVEEMSRYADELWAKAKDAKMVIGDGLPFWTPRMAAIMAEGDKFKSPSEKSEGPIALDAIGKNLSTTSGSLKGRNHFTAEETEAAMQAKFGDNTKLVRDIRAMPLAMGRMERAIAGRQMIEKIRQLSDALGNSQVADSDKGGKFFTLDHPAFTTYRPRQEKVSVSPEELAERDLHVIDGKVYKPVPNGEPRELSTYHVDQDGNVTQYRPLLDSHGKPVIDQQKLYVSREFEGPLRAVLSTEAGKVYQGLMQLKGGATGLIMYSPLIHNAVEWGRALPTMPGKVASFKIYFDGNKVKNDPKQMREFIDGGMSPIGHRFFNQDISSLMEEPSLTPGRSWTAKLLGGAAGLINERLGESVKTGIDKAGDFWHNTLLWDRVADLQAGIASSIRDDMLSKGFSRKAAVAVGAHMANRYAGALPLESMGESSRRLANVAMFSRSFTIGNLGVLKDVMTGLPGDVQAQLMRDIGKAGAQAAVGYGKKAARTAFIMDIGLMFVGNAVLQNVFDKLKRDQTGDQIEQGYVDRFHAMMQESKENPWNLLNPLFAPEHMTPLFNNEPGRQNRVLYDQDPDGTAHYVRLPTGKVGEDFTNWLEAPLRTASSKLGTIIKPALEVATNHDFFGHQIYDPNAEGTAGAVSNIGKVVSHLMEGQVPTESISAAWDLMRGQGNTKLNEMKTLGPLVGVTFSKGFPGGPVAGEEAAIERRYDAEKLETLPHIRKALEKGDFEGATKMMDTLHMDPADRKRTMNRYLNPHSRTTARATSLAYERASPSEMARLDRALEHQ